MIENFIKIKAGIDISKIYKFILYFIKNWFGTEIIDFCNLYDNILRFRTNNSVERFNLKLKLLIDHFRPKVSFFLKNIK